MSRRSITAAVAIVGTALALSACQSVDQAAIDAQAMACPEGSDCYDKVEPVGPGGAITVQANEFSFEIEDGVAIDGPVEVTLDNVGGALHNFTIDAASGENKAVEADAGSTGSGTLLLFGGTTYTYYCSIPGHRAQGMEGTLTVYTSEEEAQAAQATETPSDTASEPAASEPASSESGSEEPTPAPTESSTEG